MKTYLSLLWLLLPLAMPSLQAKDYPEESVFHLKGTWLSTDGKEVGLNSLSDRISVVALVYTTCE